MSTVAELFARPVASKDNTAIGDLLHGKVDFRAMTPSRVWEANDAQGVLAALHQWFDDEDDIQELVTMDVDSFADRQRVGYRFRLRNASGDHLVEQQAYLSVEAGRIVWLRVMCSGYRRLE